MSSIDPGLTAEVKGASPMSAKSATPRLASVQFISATQEDPVQPSTTIATNAGGRAQARRPAVLGSVAALIAAVLISSAVDANTLDWLLVIDGFVAASWWALSRHRQPNALQVLSLGAPLLAIATFAVNGAQWQLVPWQVLAVSVAAAAAFRRWRPGHSRRWRRATGRGVLGIGLALGGLALLTAFVPALPKPSGPHSVGSEILRWTDNQRPETLTSDPSDRRQVIAQAWYPTDTSTGPAVPYFEAQHHLPGSISGLPSFTFASFGRIATHATLDTAISRAQRTWPVLLLEPGLAIPREQYTALSADLASRGYVVIALSAPYESAVSVLAGGHVVGQTTNPNVMGPPPHPDVERLINIRAADAGFVLDQLSRLAQLDPGSPLAGHLDLQHVGIIGHSIGGATAVQVMRTDPRCKVAVNLDGKLFGSQSAAHLNGPLLWIQSGGPQTTEYTQGRDRLLSRLRDGGALVTVLGSVHMGFTDAPAYLRPIGRSVIGPLSGIGSISLADMTSMTGDAISAFIGPALAVNNTPRIPLHPTVRTDRLFAPRSPR
jgi:dienelactone hydrolase